MSMYPESRFPEKMFMLLSCDCDFANKNEEATAVISDAAVPAFPEVQVQVPGAAESTKTEPAEPSTQLNAEVTAVAAAAAAPPRARALHGVGLLEQHVAAVGAVLLVGSIMIGPPGACSA